MTTPDLTGSATWRDAEWRASAVAWADEQLAAVGRRRTGEPQQVHVMPWSTALRLPTDAGDVWLKSVGVGSAHEPALSVALGRWEPDHVLVPLAAAPGRRLVLLPDGGPTLRMVGGEALPEAWDALLRSYARLQIALVPHAEEMLALGVPDARPERLPALVADLVADDDALLAGRSGGIDPVVRERLIVGLDEYGEMCRALAEGGVPSTLQHDDLHDANVFIGDNRHRFFDWGDASVGHPFLSLLVALRMAAHALGLGDGHPVLHRLADGYLHEWRDHGSMDDLREQARLALRIGPLQRALSWQRVLSGVAQPERAEWQNSVPGWAAEHLEPGSLRPL